MEEDRAHTVHALAVLVEYYKYRYVFLVRLFVDFIEAGLMKPEQTMNTTFGT